MTNVRWILPISPGSEIYQLPNDPNYLGFSPAFLILYLCTLSPHSLFFPIPGIMAIQPVRPFWRPSPTSFGCFGSNQQYIYIYTYSITDMCCCQPAAAVALSSSCLCFVVPKQGPDSGPKNGATILKLVARLPNLCPNFGPMVDAFCLLQRARWAATGCIFHSCFLALGARMLVSHAGYAAKEGKKHAGPQSQKWACVAAQAKGTVQKVQGCPCCSAASMRGGTLTATSNAKTYAQPTAVYRTLSATPGTPRHQSWLTSALCKAATLGKAARLAFVDGNVDSWGSGPCLRAHIHIHHAEAALN